MKISSIRKSGRKGSVVFLNTRYGKVVRQYVCPRNPRTPAQQTHRSNLRAVLGRWRTLTPEQRAAWCIAAANKYFVTETGRQVRFNGYNFFASLNTRRADLDLPQFDLPPAEPVFGRNPVAELEVTSARSSNPFNPDHLRCIRLPFVCCEQCLLYCSLHDHRPSHHALCMVDWRRRSAIWRSFGWPF